MLNPKKIADAIKELLKPLAPYFGDPNVTEIMVNSDGQSSGATSEEEHPFFAMFEKNRLKTNI